MVNEKGTMFYIKKIDEKDHKRLLSLIFILTILFFLIKKVKIIPDHLNYLQKFALSSVSLENSKQIQPVKVLQQPSKFCMLPRRGELLFCYIFFYI